MPKFFISLQKIDDTFSQTASSDKKYVKSRWTRFSHFVKFFQVDSIRNQMEFLRSYSGFNECLINEAGGYGDGVCQFIFGLLALYDSGINRVIGKSPALVFLP